MTKVVLDVPEISCEHCSQAIARALEPQQGVQRVQVDVPSQKVHLEFDEQQISLDRVKEILAEEEYPVEAVTTA
ncbi:MAG TPA: heavy-metal-associated domain-containing protein [Chloroflexota bacterium]|jgi:copper chaperone|nr:heavy-metal-associated domain-containing protein [Chloroflexota bacterium]